MSKLPVTAKWLRIKQIFENETNGKRGFGENFEPGGEFDTLALDFAELLGDITYKFGYKCVIEGVSMDLWKERIWTIITSAGLLRTSPKHIGIGTYERDEDRIYDFKIEEEDDILDAEKFDVEVYKNLENEI